VLHLLEDEKGEAYVGFHVEELQQYAETHNIEVKKKEQVSFKKYESSKAVSGASSIIKAEVERIHRLGYGWEPGVRNEYIWRLANSCNSYGVTQANFFAWAERAHNLSMYNDHYNRAKVEYSKTENFGTRRHQSAMYEDDAEYVKTGAIETYTVNKYVTEVVDKILIKAKQGPVMVDAPTGSGKTTAMVKRQANEILLFFVPTTNLVEEFGAKHKMQRLTAQSKWWERDLILDDSIAYVMTYDQGQNLMENYHEKLKKGLNIRVVIDEAHNLVTALGYRYTALTSLNQIIQRADSVIMLTGTPQPLVPLGFDTIQIKQQTQRKDEMGYALVNDPTNWCIDYLTYRHKEKGNKTSVVMCWRKAQVEQIVNGLNERGVKAVGTSSVMNREFEVSSGFDNRPEIEVLVGTKKIAEGMSIDKRRVDNLIALEITDPVDLKQFCARPRINSPKIFGIYQESKNTGVYVAVSNVAEYIKLKKKAVECLLPDSVDGIDMKMLSHFQDDFGLKKYDVIPQALMPVQKGKVNELALARAAAGKIAHWCNSMLAALERTLKDFYEFQTVAFVDVKKLGFENEEEVEGELSKTALVQSVEDIIKDKAVAISLNRKQKQSLKGIVQMISKDALALDSFVDELWTIVQKNGGKWGKPCENYLRHVKKNWRAMGIVAYITSNPDCDIALVITKCVDEGAILVDDFVEALKAKYANTIVHAPYGEAKKMRQEHPGKTVVTDNMINDLVKTTTNGTVERPFVDGKKKKVYVPRSAKTTDELLAEVKLTAAKQSIEENTKEIIGFFTD